MPTFYMRRCYVDYLEDKERRGLQQEGDCRIFGWPRGVNRLVKINTQTFIKFTLWHYRSGGQHCWTVTLSGQNSGTAAPADNFESQFKIHERKLRSEKFPSLLQV